MMESPETLPKNCNLNIMELYLIKETYMGVYVYFLLYHT